MVTSLSLYLVFKKTSPGMVNIPNYYKKKVSTESKAAPVRIKSARQPAQLDESEPTQNNHKHLYGRNCA
jgi:hypothetical protein